MVGFLGYIPEFLDVLGIQFFFIDVWVECFLSLLLHPANLSSLGLVYWQRLLPCFWITEIVISATSEFFENICSLTTFSLFLTLFLGSRHWFPYLVYLFACVFFKVIYFILFFTETSEFFIWKLTHLSVYGFIHWEAMIMSGSHVVFLSLCFVCVTVCVCFWVAICTLVSCSESLYGWLCHLSSEHLSWMSLCISR